MLYIIRGIDALIVNGKQIDPDGDPAGVPAHRLQDHRSGCPWLTILVLVVVLVAGVLPCVRSGPAAISTPSAPTRGRRAGRRPDRTPGVHRVPHQRRRSPASPGRCSSPSSRTVDATGGTGYELNVVAAVVVGGVAIFGGSGTVLGAALGALLLNTINQALVAAKVSAFWNQAVAGALLLAAITFDRWLALRVARA